MKYSVLDLNLSEFINQVCILPCLENEEKNELKVTLFKVLILVTFLENNFANDVRVNVQQVTESGNIFIVIREKNYFSTLHRVFHLKLDKKRRTVDNIYFNVQRPLSIWIL